MFVLLVVAIIDFVCLRRRKKRAKDAIKKGKLVKIVKIRVGGGGGGGEKKPFYEIKRK